ncbi:MAG TPA: MFS transporter, partial [Flavobacteriales bacterium]|jgi:POT family proton-dependent oligopeptide transporter|nr:MFS transporter [Flavobacteriales bacterium]
MWLSLVYCVGCFILAAFHTDLPLFQLGLFLIAMGAGGIKPCVSANVGDQFDESNQHLIGKAFSLFYFSINFGSFFSTLLIPLVYRYWGPAWAFGIPGGLMFLATVIFFLGRHRYRRVPPKGVSKANFLSINLHAATKGGWAAAADRFGEERVSAVKAVWRILALFAFTPVFWALLDQNSSEWVLQATKLDLHFAGVNWLPEQIQSLNPILVLAFIPLFSFVVFPWLERRGMRLSPHRKIGWGFVLLVCAFVVIWLLQRAVDAGARPSVGWQAIAYVLLTAGEVLVYNTGLEFAYTQAPPSMKSTIMSFWLITIALGNWIVSLINSSIAHGGWFARLTGADYFLFFIVLMSVTTAIYFVRYRKERRGVVEVVG